ncbi:MAG: TetR/AcrR family transcriptional regulator [Flavobacteriales bacterium]|nr:TetR/AcrR family transcriptional regulator [Flavobacteriales bacterium]
MDVKTQIVEKSLQMFMRFGIKSVSMDDISQELGISKKTLYQYVADKKELVRLSLQHHLESDSEVCSSVMESTENAIQQLLDLARHLAMHFKELNPSTIYDIQKYYPSCWKLFHEHREGFILNQVSRNLERGIKSGLYRKEINPEMVSRIYISLIDASVNLQTFPSKLFNQVDVYMQIMAYHLHAIMSDKGREYYEIHKKTLLT